MDRISVGVVGASGYTGSACARLLAGHPNVDLVFCTSDKWKSEGVRARLGPPIDGDLVFCGNGDAIARAVEVDAVLLATPAETSIELAPKLLQASVSVIDLSGAFRLADARDYRRWYRLDHSEPALLARAHYGLPEIFGAPTFAADGSALVANPGCYPTAATIALAPLVRAGLVHADGLIIDAKSGVSGAGRQAREEYSFVEVASDARAYKILQHQHTPEIARSLGRVCDRVARVTFTPHLVPIARGILATCYARPADDATAAKIEECLREAYWEALFVSVVEASEVTLARVVGTNECVVGVACDDDIVIVTASIDNLIKGAAGQAIQNLNLLYGLPENAGLDTLTRHAC